MAGSVARLVLVRHAQVAPDPALPATAWPLSDRGVADAAALGRHAALEEVPRFYHSPKVKAASTAAIIASGRPVVPLADLRELERGAAGWLPDPEGYRRLVLEILRRPDESVQGCEPARQAQRRVTEAVSAAVAGAEGRTVAVVSHGIALTLYLCHLLQLDPPDPTIWESIGTPDLAVVDPIAGRVLVPFRGPG